MVLHLAFVIKGDFFSLSGDVWKPLVAAIVIGVLLIVRLPRIKRAFAVAQASGARRPTPIGFHPDRIQASAEA